MVVPVVRIGRVALKAALPMMEDMVIVCVELEDWICGDAETIQWELCAMVCLD